MYTNTLPLWLYECASGNYLLTAIQDGSSYAAVRRHLHLGRHCSAGIRQRLSCKALIYVDIFIEALSLEIPARNAADYQVNIALISPYRAGPFQIYIHTNFGS